MSFAITKYFREPWESDKRLSEMQLTKQPLLDTVDIAVDAAGEKTPFHCANAAGTFSYQYGTFALRANHVGDIWKINRDGGVEAILNEALKIKVVFQNVDRACDDDQGPKPIGPKGSGTERVCSGNLFPSLPEYVPEPSDEYAVYYLMVDANGAAELTRPVVKNNTFSGYIERIYLTFGRPEDELDISFDDGDATEEFDPVVARK